MERADELLQKYTSNLPDSGYRNYYASCARKFLNYADDLDKESIKPFWWKVKKE